MQADSLDTVQNKTTVFQNGIIRSSVLNVQKYQSCNWYLRIEAELTGHVDRTVGDYRLADKEN